MSDAPREQLLAAVGRHDLFSGLSGVLCALSGGADSVVLLCLLQEICPTRGLSLRALHVNHGIRGAEAARDEEFCRALCRRLGVPLTVLAVDAPALAQERGIGLEEAARELRYRAFEETLRPGEAVATAHNATDNAETVLFHLLRGSGSRGLSGIPPRRGRVIRPLLFCGREEIRAYAAVCGIEYVEDSTNSDLAYTRNYIRTELIPRARRVNPAFERAILCAGEHLREEDACFCADAREFLSGVSRPEAGGTAVPLDGFCALSAPLRVRVLAAMYSKLSENALVSVHFDAVLSLAERGAPHSSLNLPGHIVALIEGGELRVQPYHAPAAREEYELPLREGRNVFEGKDFEILLLRELSPKTIEKNENIYKLFIFDKINFDKIKDKLFIRTRRSGDAYRAGGMTRRVRRLLSERGVPPAERDHLPIVCDGEGIVWLPGCPVADRRRPSPDGETVWLCYGKKE